MKWLMFFIPLLALFNHTPALAATDDDPVSVSVAGDFQDIIMLTADHDFALGQPDILPDPDSNFLRDFINMSQKDIDDYRASVEAMVLDRFGLDFTNLPTDGNNFKVIPGVAMLGPVVFPQEFNYRALYMDGHGVHKTVRTGGFFVTVIGNGLIYHGEFGGALGKPALPGDLLASGFYHVAGRGDDEPTIIRLQPNVPAHATPDGMVALKGEVFHPRFGAGLLDGLGGASPNPDGGHHNFVRNVMTFPGRLPDPHLEEK